MPYSYISGPTVIGINRMFTVNGNVLNQGNLDNAILEPQREVYGQEIHQTLAAKAAAFVRSLSQGHPFHDANKRTASTALDYFIKENRGGRGIVGGVEKSRYLVGRCADQDPIGMDELTVAIGKLIPAPRLGEMP